MNLIAAPIVDLAFIGDRIARLRAEIPPHICIVGITKGVPAECVRIARDAGLRHFGESRIQEAEPKLAQLGESSDCQWHLIGHLQTNKARKAVQLFDWIDSVDSLKLALRLDRLAGELNRRPQVCLQVKLAPDPDKFGWSPAELQSSLPQLAQLSHLRFRGLMTILPAGLSPDESIGLFSQLRAMGDRLQLVSPFSSRADRPFVLSMGMSGDYRSAIAAGATHVRIGRSIFKKI